MTMEELSNVQGRAWEDVDVSSADFPEIDLLLTFYSIDEAMNGCMREKAVDSAYYIPLLLHM
jgi:hypothetical protein